MRIALVNSASVGLWGGGEKWFTEAAAWLAAQGHEVVVVGRPGSRLLDAAGGQGLRTRAFSFGGDYDPIASFRAGRILARERPDLVLVNFNKEAWLFGRGASLFGIPLVARHGLLAFRPKLVHHLLERWHIRRLVVNAPSIARRYAELGFDTRKIEVILNGVRPQAAQPGEMRRRFGIEPSVPLVVTAGRLAGQKRLERFVAIAARLSAEIDGVRFLVMGDGAMRAPLEGWVREAGLEDRFVIPGFVADYAAIAGDADLYLLTSENEGTPNALLETMAAGVPSLAFEVGAVPEILTGELSAARVPAGDVEEMTRRALRLLGDRAARQRLGAALRRHALEELSFDRSMGRYVALFEELVERPRPR